MRKVRPCSNDQLIQQVVETNGELLFPLPQLLMALSAIAKWPSYPYEFPTPLTFSTLSLSLLPSSFMTPPTISITNSSPRLSRQTHSRQGKFFFSYQWNHNYVVSLTKSWFCFAFWRKFWQSGDELGKGLLLLTM